jgi:protein-S-isoprenylcysteine O-methyltransferase Ste14
MIVEYFIGLAYLSLAIELIFFPVKSSGSTYRLLIEQKLGRRKKIQAIIENIIVVTVIIYPIGNLLFKWDNLITSRWMLCIGIFLVIMGRFFSFGAMLQLRNYEDKLQTDKFFKISRNPNIDGTILFLIGMWFLMPSILFLVGMTYVFYYMVSRAKLEEKYLEERFGLSFLKYKSSTKRSIFYDRG